MQEALNAFARGDYLSAARTLTPDDWQYWASLGLIAHPAAAAAALQRFPDPEAVFYRGAAAWISGDDEEALGVLDRCSDEHASRLASLIRRRPITVLTQLPWNRCGAWDLLTTLRDPAFRLVNISFHPDDIPNRPYADIRALVPAGVRPDFFVAEMIEWHLIAPNVRDLACPVIGHSSDFDLHIQTVAPWLDLFDELVVLDSVEWSALSRVAQAPVSVFPKVFGVPTQLPVLDDRERDIDIFLSGTVMHPYHTDKNALVLDVLRLPDIRLRMINGFEGTDRYYENLSRSKVSCTYIRHPGAMPTRALEALGMGCVVAVQEENALRLFVDDAAGVVPYGNTTEPVGAAIQRVLSRWSEYADRARAGAQIVRREFALDRVASQYFRYLAVVAARPRRDTPAAAPDLLVQKRAVVHKGWLPSYTFGGGVLMEWAAESDARITRELEVEETPRLLNDLARERLLAHYHDCGSAQQWLPGVRVPLERAIRQFPSALVPRLNLVRVLLHFGSPADVRHAIALLDHTLARPADAWDVHPLDDVLPWDFCPAFFNYRRYFDAVTRWLHEPELAKPELLAVIRAALCHYRARYASELPAERSGLEWAAEAASLDRGFADYVLFYCRLLIARARPSDLDEAATLLRQMAERSARVLEILDLARHLPASSRQRWYVDLDALAVRFWSATELREHLAEPPLRSATAVGPGTATRGSASASMIGGVR